MGQCERVLKYMQDFDTINPLQALGDLGVMRLALGYGTFATRGIKSPGVWSPGKTDTARQ